jgi:hypothetical protein
MPRRRLIALAVACAVVGATGVRAQSTAPAARLPVIAATDTTVSFRVLNFAWIRSGTHGTILNPTKRDTLVGIFVVARVDTGVALGTITGLQAGVDTLDVAVIPYPRVPWYKRATFWVGALVGAAATSAVAIFAR